MSGLQHRDRTAEVIDRMVRPYPHKAVSAPDPHDMADKVLMLKLNNLESKVDILTELVGTLTAQIRQLQADRYPKYVGTREACQILGISATTMDKRLKAGYYTFAIKERNRWKFPLNELYRFQGQL